MKRLNKVNIVLRAQDQSYQWNNFRIIKKLHTYIVHLWCLLPLFSLTEMRDPNHLSRAQECRTIVYYVTQQVNIALLLSSLARM